MRLVTAASPDKTVQPSMNGSSGAPTPPIWIMWSITENQTKPWFSAHCALALTLSKASVGSGPNTHDGLWMPNFIEIAPVLSFTDAREFIRRRELVVLWYRPKQPLANRPGSCARVAPFSQVGEQHRGPTALQHRT